MKAHEFQPTIESMFYHYAAPPSHVVAGKYLPLLEQARLATHATWQEKFGRDLPDGVAMQDYVLSSVESAEAKAAVGSLFGSNTLLKVIKGTDGFSRIEVDGEMHEYSQVFVKAARLRHDTYRSIVDFPANQRGLMLADGIEPTPHFPYRQTPGINTTNVECALMVFGMAACAAADVDTANRQGSFDAARLKSKLSKLPNKPAGAEYDLPWLLGALTTDYAESVLGKKVRLRTTVGASLDEIDRRFITPLCARNPAITCAVSASLTSETSPRANHMVIVKSADAEIVTVNDPKYDEPKVMEAREFWNRWTPQHMQASIMIMQPV